MNTIVVHRSLFSVHLYGNNHVLVARRRPVRPATKLAGKPAPDAEFKLTDGTPFNIKSEDKDTFVMFYASWCGFCKRSLPQIDAMHKEYQEKNANVRFVAVSLDTLVEDGADPSTNKRARTKEQVVKQWKDLNLSLPQAFDPAMTGKNQYKVQSFPTMFLVSKKGVVERAFVGGGALTDGPHRAGQASER